ncbi:DNA cytosine methyltransferase [Brucella sp. MAB-22]|uniref:DNA cytosine methyltransferase n=1 Tax=Brucella sp. MAB-22 TaxID=2986424 RepID=UPI00221F9FCF|nr:DNA cytosine methyltransferase [Brucella sp. MAB-22]UYT54134.1 DNA cytosine methyltransferase [Brucella sp. MAB-22]
MKHDNDNNALRFLSVCSGIEAASVAWRPLGWQAVAFSEIEKFPSAVLAHHYPDVPNLGDFTKIDTTRLGRVDILCGGTPCQAFSIAGARRSLEDERGNLTLSFVELAHELAAGNGLRNVIWENVPGVLSTKDNAFGCFLAGLVGADDPIVPTKRWSGYGMVSGPKGRAAWAVKDAQFFGLAQRRKRVIVVADFGNGADPAAVLFEPESMCRDTPPSRSPQESHTRDVAPSLRAQSNCSLRDDSDAYVAVSSSGDVAHCLNAGGMGQQDYETETMVAHPYTLAIRGRGESHDLEYRQDGTANALLTPNGGRAGIGVGAVCAPVAFMSNASGANLSVGNNISPTLRIGGDGGNAMAIAWSIMPQNSGKDFKARQVDVSQPLMAGGPVGGNQGGDYIQQQWAVRRLTPTECELLQGFPDGYTNIPWRGKPDSPDGPRYKALGNSWAVPKFKWLGERVAKLMPPVAANDNHKRSERNDLAA